MMLTVLLALVPARLEAWFNRLPLHNRILLGVALTVFVVELILRTWARGTLAYKRWTAFFQAIGAVWTAVILSVVYFVSVGLVSLFQRLFGHDRLDRRLDDGKPTAWHAHEPSPLGERQAARHQF